MSAPAIVIFLGGILSLIGAFWSSTRQSNFNATLAEKNNEIGRLTQENNNLITGGDSFCLMDFLMYDSEGKIFSGNNVPDVIRLAPIFFHQGKYPLYEVFARIVDLDEANRMPADPAAQWGTNVEVRGMTPRACPPSQCRWRVPTRAGEAWSSRRSFLL